MLWNHRLNRAGRASVSNRPFLSFYPIHGSNLDVRNLWKRDPQKFRFPNLESFDSSRMHGHCITPRLGLSCYLTRRCHKVKIHLRTPKGGWVSHLPWILVFPSEFLRISSHGYVIRDQGILTVIMKKFYLYCMSLENQGQTPFCMTFLISGCKHCLRSWSWVSILTFSRSWISNMLKKIMWPWRLTLKLKVTHIHCMTFLISGSIQAKGRILVSILTFARSRIVR